MTVTSESHHANDLVSHLYKATLPVHEELDRQTMSAEPFVNRASYERLLRMHYCLQRDFEPLYHDEALKQRLSDLESRSRFAAVTQDMADLGLDLPVNDQPLALPLLDVAESVGWLFVLEGSRLGGRSMLRRALELGLSESFGARHLAGTAGGVSHDWHVFSRIVSALPFNDEERERAMVGASSAFEHCILLVQRYLLSAA